ncbi:ATP-binding cassette domain-containing protein [Vreelandella alkaliphila]|uniref:ATP-binding cassette domain-containing protein n=1 Tax=Vreelandella alkaliphila TaxID=272774 RepID=UPI003FD736FF
MGDLSGGQRQLVSAAQALVQEPEILMLDEPTSALDLNRQINLLSVLRRLADERNMLILVALHDLGHALRFTDAAMVLEHGRLIACGPTEEVISPELLRQVYKVTARIEPCSKGRPQLIVEEAV